MLSLKHKFQSQLPDGVNPSLIRPSNWNDEHDLVLSQTGVIVGRKSAGAGSAEELTAADVAVILNGKFLADLVDDTTPQLGGDLDLNGHHITGLQIGTDVQAYSANLDSWSLVVPGSYLTVAAAAAGYQPLSANLTTWASLAPSVNAQSLVTAADYSAMRTLLGLVIGTNVQAYDADLTTWAGLTPSANFQTMVPHTFAQMRTDLGLVIGTNVQAWDADLDTWATKAAPSGTVLGSDSLDTDVTLAANSDSKIATQKAVKTYVDAHTTSSAIGFSFGAI